MRLYLNDTREALGSFISAASFFTFFNSSVNFLCWQTAKVLCSVLFCCGKEHRDDEHLVRWNLLFFSVMPYPRFCVDVPHDGRNGMVVLCLFFSLILRRNRRFVVFTSSFSLVRCCFFG